MPVQVVHFNPQRPRVRGPLGRIFREPLNNFGDVIGPVLVRRIVEQRGLVEPEQDRRLVAVGSIMKLSRPGDVVWGTGVNGKSMDVGGGADLDVRAVRGPKTRSVLMDAGVSVPEVFGDPILLWSQYWPGQQYLAQGAARDVTVVPNYNDFPSYKADSRAVDPRIAYHDVIGTIVRSNFVCGSSLHGIVIAESYGIPARLIGSAHEPQFKYDDYYLGTGRASYKTASSVEEAIAMGGEEPPAFDADRLLNAFPEDMWARP